MALPFSLREQLSFVLLFSQAQTFSSKGKRVAQTQLETGLTT
jgi:hypothetical protein